MSGIVKGANCGGATQCNCGDILIENYTIEEDLIGCPGNGLTIGADYITLNCNNNNISGLGSGTGIFISYKKMN